MTIASLRATISWIILLTHITTIALTPFLLIEFDKALDVILVLMPLTGLYVGVIVNFYTTHMVDASDEKISTNFAVLSIFLCGSFCLAIIGVQLLYHEGVIATIEQVKKAVSIIETGLGVYSGFLIKALFKGAGAEA
jgi:hypothetical protein